MFGSVQSVELICIALTDMLRQSFDSRYVCISVELFLFAINENIKFSIGSVVVWPFASFAFALLFFNSS